MASQDAPPGYVEFATLSNFAFLRGASHAEELVATAINLGLTGLGLADINSVAGVVRAHGALRDLRKQHPDLAFRYHPGSRLVFTDGTPDILAYPLNRAGWGRLCRLLTLGNRRAEKGQCHLTGDDLLAHAGDLAFTVLPWTKTRGAAPGPRQGACPLGPDFKALADAAPGRIRLAARMAYGGLDRRILAETAARARAARVPLIAVNDVLYHAPSRRPLQDVLTAIRTHTTLETAGRRLEANAERHLKPPAEMARLFRDCPEAIAETLVLSRSLTFSLDDLKYEYPDEVLDGFATAQAALVHFTFEGAHKRYPDGLPDKVRFAIAHEIELIGQLGYAQYFLTVFDIVRFARSQGILCQGRGSAANSAVCFCLGVTEVDPDKSDLLFERFVSANRREPPDIDVDFEHERREEVIQYIYRRYGRERAGLAATVISYRARSSIREVGRVFSLAEDTLDAMSGSIWGWGADGIDEIDTKRSGVERASPVVRQTFDLARQIAGFPRHLSQHVGGFVITRGRLDELVPIQNAAMADRTVIEWDKDDLDTLGILKVDVLGLGMLSCLRNCFNLLERHYGGDACIVARQDSQRPLLTVSRTDREHASVTASEIFTIGNEASSRQSSPGQDPGCDAPRSRSSVVRDTVRRARGIPLTIATIPAEDPAVYRMLQRADSLGVFQVESRAQMSMLPRLKPENFYDLVIEVAIVRPGPIQGDMVHPYLRRKQGLEQVSYPSKELEAVLGKTLGVPLFQEQAMKIAIVAAGFTPSEADGLRRAMATFRKVGTIGTFQTKMVEGMVANGYERAFAERCFKQLEGFGEYGFPESHAASFALLVYASCWMKCHYPDVFAAALLNAQPLGFYAPAQIVRDAREHGVEARAPDVNGSDWDATLEPVACRWGSKQVSFLITKSQERDEAAERTLSNQSAEGCLGPRLRGDDGGESCARLGPPLYLRHRSMAEATPPFPPDGGRAGDGGGVQQPISWTPPTPHARLHPRHCSMAGDIWSTHALRLGLREIKGLSEAAGRLIAERRGQGYDSVRDVWLRTGLAPSVLERLADADAFGSLGLTRRDALWAVTALGRTGDASQDLPLFAQPPGPQQEPDVALPAMPPGEEVVNDYRFLKMSLKAHPVQFVRTSLDVVRVVRNEHLLETAPGRRIAVAGLVLVRQRPGSAKGVIFMTLEDEGGVANVIVWPKVFEKYRPVILGARFVVVYGRLQSEHGIIHIIADRIADRTDLLAQLAEDTGCVSIIAHADEVKRPQGDMRERRIDAEVKRRERLAEVNDRVAQKPRPAESQLTLPLAALDVPARATRHALPKGRNFR